MIKLDITQAAQQYTFQTVFNNRSNLILSLFSFLPSLQDRLNLSIVGRNFPSLTDRAWEMMSIKDHFNFSWSDTKKEKYPHRLNYILGAALTTYIVQRQRIAEQGNWVIISTDDPSHFYAGQIQQTPEQDLAQLSQRYEGLKKRFPLFGSFLSQDMNKKGSFKLTTTSTQSSCCLVKIFRKAKPEDDDQRVFGGDLLLKSLFDMRRCSKPRQQAALVKYAGQAIDNGATCISLLASQVYKDWTEENLLGMAIKAALKNDLRALEKVVENLSLDVLITLMPVGPVLARMAVLTDDINEKDRLYDLAIADYGPQRVPDFVLASSAAIKFKLKKFPEAESLYDQAISKYQVPPLFLLSEAGSIKLESGKLQDAESFYDQILSRFQLRFGDRPENQSIAFFNLHASFSASQNTYFIQYQTRDNLGEVLVKAGQVKCKLKKFPEANAILDLAALEYYGGKPPESVLEMIRIVKSRLKMEEVHSRYKQKLLEIQSLYTQKSSEARSEYDLASSKDGQNSSEALSKYTLKMSEINSQSFLKLSEAEAQFNLEIEELLKTD